MLVFQQQAERWMGKSDWFPQGINCLQINRNKGRTWMEGIANARGQGQVDQVIRHWILMSGY